MAAKGGKTTPCENKGRCLADGEASAFMLKRVPTAGLDETVRGVRERVISRKNWDTIDYIYVLDAKKRLKGVLSVKELFRARLTAPMKTFASATLVTAHPHTKLPVVASRTLAHNLKACPIVDHDGAFLGAVGIHTVMTTLEHEHVGDLLRSSGLHTEKQRFVNVFAAKIRQVVEWRTPWLVAGVFGGMAAAAIVDGFSKQLEEVIALASFIPVMVYMGDAVGTQTQMLFIRGIAFRQIKAHHYLAREIVIDALIGACIAVLLGVFAMLFTNSAIVTMIVAVSSFLIVASAGTVAIAVSLLLLRFGRDPAVGGGPFTTIIQDLLSLVIYFAVASLFIL